MKVSNRWLGQWGMLANQIAKQHQDSTEEQRENMDEFWNAVLGGMEKEGLKELENGVFSNSNEIVQAVFGRGDMKRYMSNIMNLFTNIIQPATIAQINRASLDEVPSSKGDGFLDTLNQNYAQRSLIYRKLFDVQLRYKRDIWGQTIPKGGNILSRMLGISKANPQVFARPLYDAFLKTDNNAYLPPAVQPNLNGQKLTVEQYNKLQEYVGGARKKLIEPYINSMATFVGFNKLYSELTEDQKLKALNIIYEVGYDEGKAKFLKEYPEFVNPRKELEQLMDDAKSQGFRQKAKFEVKKE
jgi:hypothetical protein